MNSGGTKSEGVGKSKNSIGLRKGSASPREPHSYVILSSGFSVNVASVPDRLGSFGVVAVFNVVVVVVVMVVVVVVWGLWAEPVSNKLVLFCCFAEERRLRKLPFNDRNEAFRLQSKFDLRDRFDKRDNRDVSDVSSSESSGTATSGRRGLDKVDGK